MSAPSDHDLLVRIDERVTGIAAAIPEHAGRIHRLEWAIPGLLGIGGLLGLIFGGIL